MENRIAVVTNGYSNEFVQHVLDGLKKRAAENDDDIFVFVSYLTPINNVQQNECQYNIFELPNPKMFKGAIVLANTFYLKQDQEAATAVFQKSNIPIVTLEESIPNASCISSENYKGVYELANHLIEEHHAQRIIYISGVQDSSENATRKQALLDSLSEHNLSLTEEINCDFSFYDSYSKILSWLNQGNELPDAFVCANDIMALGVNTALDSLHYSVPEDVIVTGFDMITNGQFSFPILATVSPGWEHFGELAYDRLMWQIEHPNEYITETHDSTFIPSESCGCCPTKKSIQLRNKKMKNLHFEATLSGIQDIFFQRLRLAELNVEKKKDFYEKGKDILGDAVMVPTNYCICTEPAFFDVEDKEYTKRITSYSQNMDVLYENRDGKGIPLYSYNRDELYPGYTKKEGESNLYIFAPFNFNNFLIGYVAIKNDDNMLCNQSLAHWIMNMNTVFLSMRRYVFSQRNNRRLQEIYMTDSLTGMYNRTGCETILFEFIKTQKEKNKTSILVFADIDRMKTINDVYGHLNGDLAIKATADAFRKYSPDRWIFGRYGGDEFIAVGPCEDTDEVPTLISKISSSMYEYFESLNLSFMLHASIGYTIISDVDEGDIEDYINQADKSMYKEKEKMHAIIDSSGIQ